jgi:hypothetical protein
MEDGSRRKRLQSFAIGGLVGAASVVATARRARRRRGPAAATGITAFEDAPCYLEIVSEEAQRYRGGGETVTGTSNPT